MTLGERIKRSRLDRGMSQKALAGEQITRNMLSQIENGQATPSMKTLQYLAERLDVSPSRLLGEEEGEKKFSLAKRRYRAGDYMGALKALQAEGVTGDEGNLILSKVYGALARTALEKTTAEEAVVYAKKAISSGEKSLYEDKYLRICMLGILARCALLSRQGEAEALEEYREEILEVQAATGLLAMEEHMARGNYSIAEQICTRLLRLPDALMPHFYLLRGKLCAVQKKFSEAVPFLKQAEAAAGENKRLLQEVYELLELCFREQEDFRSAYEYAGKRREL